MELLCIKTDRLHRRYREVKGTAVNIIITSTAPLHLSHQTPHFHRPWMIFVGYVSVGRDLERKGLGSPNSEIDIWRGELDEIASSLTSPWAANAHALAATLIALPTSSFEGSAIVHSKDKPINTPLNSKVKIKCNFHF